MIKNFTLFRQALLAFFLIELFSYFSYSIPQLSPFTFWLLSAACLLLSVRRLEYGVLMVLGELFIGSKGYLYFTELNGIKLSIRIALWSIVMFVWFGKYALYLWRERALSRQLAAIKSKKFGLSFALLFLAAAWGLTHGWISQPSFGGVFLDANAWAYLGLIFPLYWIRNAEALPHKIWSIFWAAAVWLSFKTLFLLYIFSHGQTLLIFSLYHWVRNTGIGEITQIEGGFYRIFIQSQIFNLLGIFLAMWWLVAEGAKKQLLPFIRERQTKIIILFLALNLITILLSFSRSFWVGAAAGCTALAIWLAIKARGGGGTYFHKIAHSIKLVATTAVLAIILSTAVIGSTIAFPWPRPTGGFSTTDLFSDRLTESNESAIGSRWALLPKLWERIKSDPIRGQGFGAEVTYRSQDPRVLKDNPDGSYTTSAFEWGWLDIWLKLGIFGLLSYLYLLYKIGREDWDASNTAMPAGALAVGLIILAAVHIFTPYLNHPLGIGYLLIAAALLEARQQ